MHKFSIHGLGALYLLVLFLTMVGANTLLLTGICKYDLDCEYITFEPSVLVVEDNRDVLCEEIGNIAANLPPVSLSKISNVTDEEEKLLAQIAFCEAGTEGIPGMRRVVSVVLNRRDSGRFPDTIEKVLYSPGQFDSVRSKHFGAVTADAKCAVKEELSCRTDTESLYFARTPLTQDGLYQFGNHFFSK